MQKRFSDSILMKYDENNNPIGEIEYGGDLSGRISFNTVFGDQITAKKVDTISVKFDAGIIASQVVVAGANGGTATESNSRGLFQSSTTTNGSIVARSRDIVRYRPGHEMFAYFTYAWLDGGVAGAKNYIGIMDANNGYYIGYNGPDFVVGRRKGGAGTEYPRSSFTDKLDGSGLSGHTIDFTKINIFRVTFGYLGIAPAIFEVYGGKARGWIEFANIDLTNISTELSIESPNLPISIEIVKTSGTTNVRGVSGSWNGGFYNGGDMNVGNVTQGYDTGLGQALTGTGFEAVVTFRLKNVFNGKSNTASARLVHSNFGNTATGDIIIGKIIANPTSIGGVGIGSLTWSDINSSTSMIEYKAGGGVIVGGTRLFTEYMIGGGSGASRVSGQGSVNADDLGLIGRPGDVFTVGYQRVSGSGSYNSLLAMNWIELF